MKPIIVAAILLLLLSVSCNDASHLKSQIIELREKNKVLSDSLKKINYHNLVSSQLILIPQVYSFNENGGKVVGMFRQMENFPKFHLYYADEKFKIDKQNEIKYKLTKDNAFEFNIDRENIKSKEIRVIAFFNLDTTNVQLCGITGTP
ncbi:MAG: hypothetical protein ACO1N9_08010 [Flavobacterium sp.]